MKVVIIGAGSAFGGRLSVDILSRDKFGSKGKGRDVPSDIRHFVPGIVFTTRAEEMLDVAP
ncbi:MAG: hypothetical protein R6V03_06930 [Kiritimatiellia bacterium]